MNRNNVWLIIELILSTVALWWALDPIVVNTYVTNIPLGYDPSRLVELKMGSGFKEEEDDWFMPDNATDYQALTARLETLPEVECVYVACNDAAPLFSLSATGSKIYNDQGDSTWQYTDWFYPGSRMFEAYGIAVVSPDVSAQELTKGPMDDDAIIITRSFAMFYFGTTDAAGRKVRGKRTIINDDGEPAQEDHFYTVRGVVADHLTSTTIPNPNIIYRMTSAPYEHPSIVLRLAEGISPKQFTEKYKHWLETELRSGNIYMWQAVTGDEAISICEKERGITRQNQRHGLIALFFAINIAIGVIGTLLMHTRRRSEEAGVKRAFGASSLRIFGMFMTEAVVLTTICVAIGCLIYMQIALARGLYAAADSDYATLWLGHFWPHFAVVSVVVWTVVMTTSLIGTAIPAWQISRARIVNTLKDE